MTIHLDLSIDLETFTIISKTPLHYAASKGHVEVAKLLVECGADINVENVRERCFLMAFDMAFKMTFEMAFDMAFDMAFGMAFDHIRKSIQEFI